MVVNHKDTTFKTKYEERAAREITKEHDIPPEHRVRESNEGRYFNLYIKNEVMLIKQQFSVFRSYISRESIRTRSKLHQNITESK